MRTYKRDRKREEMRAQSNKAQVRRTNRRREKRRLAQGQARKETIAPADASMPLGDTTE